MMRSPFVRNLESGYVALTPVERWSAVAVLAVVAGVSGGMVFGAAKPSLLVVWLGFLLYLAVLAVPFLLPRFRPGLFHPLVFYVLWNGFRSLLEGQAVLAVTGLSYHRAVTALTEPALNAVVALSFFLEAVAYVALYVGYGIAPRLRIPVFSTPEPRGVPWKAALWVALSAVALIILARHAGGLSGLLMQRGIPSNMRVGAQIGGHWSYFASAGVVAPLVWLACCPAAVKRPFFWSVLVASLVIKFAATGSRGGTLIPILMIGAVWMLQRRTIPLRLIFAGMLLMLIGVGLLGEYRISTMRADSLNEVAIEGGINDWIMGTVEELQAGAGANSGQIAVLARVPEDTDYLYGASYVSIPFIPIPRAWLGDKPPAGGKLVAERLYGNDLNTIPPEGVGEAFWNFSYIGVVVVFLASGLMLCILAQTYRANPSHPAVIVIFICVLFYFTPSSDSIYSVAHKLIPPLLMWGTMVMRFRR